MVHLRHRNLLQTMAATIFPPFYRHRAARKRYFRVLSSSRSAGTILLPFYRHRAAREQYFCLFIVTAQRGNNIFAFYRHRAARKRYFCVLSSPCGAGTIFLCFIVAVQRGNNIFAVLSSSRGAETIFLPFYRHRAAREQYFCISVLAVLLQIHSRTVLTFAVQLRASRNVARTARGCRRASCRGKTKSSHPK